MSGLEGVYSVPMISSIAYQCVLLRVNPEDVDKVKEMLKSFWPHPAINTVHINKTPVIIPAVILFFIIILLFNSYFL